MTVGHFGPPLKRGSLIAKIVVLFFLCACVATLICLRYFAQRPELKNTRPRFLPIDRRASSAPKAPNHLLVRIYWFLIWSSTGEYEHSAVGSQPRP